MKIRIRSLAGGCVVTAVTRQNAGVPPEAASVAAASIVVFLRESEVRLSQVRTGCWVLAGPARIMADISAIVSWRI
jgi:hypothetical protein